MSRYNAMFIQNMKKEDVEKGEKMLEFLDLKEGDTAFFHSFEVDEIHGSRKWIETFNDIAEVVCLKPEKDIFGKTRIPARVVSFNGVPVKGESREIYITWHRPSYAPKADLVVEDPFRDMQTLFDTAPNYEKLYRSFVIFRTYQEAVKHSAFRIELIEKKVKQKQQSIIRRAKRETKAQERMITALSARNVQGKLEEGLDDGVRLSSESNGYTESGVISIEED